MSDWRIRRAYGWGAGSVCLAPDLTRSLPPAPTLAGGLRELVVEVHAAGLRRTLGLVGGVPALALFAVLLVSLLATLTRDPTDVLEVEVVAFELPPEEPEPAPEPPPPPVRVAAARPSPVPPPPVPAPEPPRAVVVAPEPPLRPLPRPEPPPRPRITFEPAPQLARAEPPPPQPVRRPLPRPDLAPPPVAPAASLAIDPLAAPAASARAELPAARRPARLTPVAAPAAPDVAIDPLAAPSLSSVPRERVALASRTAAPRPSARASRPAPVAPRFDLAVPASHAPSSAASRARSERPSAPVPTRSGVRTDPPKGLAPAAFDAPGAAPVLAPTREANRLARVTPDPAEAARGPQPAERLEAVPLSALAACVSDREEDGLKLDVLGAVGGREECSSPAGRYRFVETKNLNAFLMWIERSSSRRQTDRCIELRLALECLHGAEHRRGR